ncbi:guanine nucleotide binding protein, alpha subunit [Pilobolus umbonatus]|nr:guanine nucleotide binding protein, alpha subunit [Pilobolus umbonatus]
MGCGFSRTKHGVIPKNKGTDSQIKKDRQTSLNEIKLLLLGASESGKSTLLKQMRMIHHDGLTEEVRMSYRGIIYKNIILSIKAVVVAMDRLNIKLTDPDQYQGDYDLIYSLPSQLVFDQFPCVIGKAIGHIWHDEGIKKAYRRHNEYQLIDSAEYYFNEIDRISHIDYIPTDQDILRAEEKTTEISETLFNIGSLVYRIIDVGGLRSERKKWLTYFEGVSVIIFMVALSEYDQRLYEDERVNRLQESLTLFQSICNMKCFIHTSTILFMNKTDLFRIKLKMSPLKKFFSKYKGGNDYQLACRFLMNQFQSVTVSNPVKKVYTHFTCATDTEQVRAVMSAVSDIILISIQKNTHLI